MLPAIIVVGAIVTSIMHRGDEEAAKQAEHVRDSLKRVEKIDSIKMLIENRDEITRVMYNEGDSIYHYYINCYYIFIPDKLKITKRSEAKKNGMKTCPDCLELEKNYMIEKGDYMSSEGHLQLLESIYRTN